MYRKKDSESCGISQVEVVITSTNGYNENTIYKPSNSSIKSAAIKNARFDLTIIDELYNEPILLEQGGFLESEDY